MLLLKHSNTHQMQNNTTYPRQSTLNLDFKKQMPVTSLTHILNKQNTRKAEYSFFFLQVLNPFWKLKFTNVIHYPV